MARSWGFWTRYKLELLQRYLDGFATASKKAGKIVYLDLFAGEVENVDRATKLPIDGSPRIALGISDQAFAHLRFFEMGPNVTELREAFSMEFPKRDCLVYEDCNASIVHALRELTKIDAGWAPTFAFIDPNGAHCRWTTLEALASHKPPTVKTKVELWMLFPDPLFARLLPKTGDVRPADNVAITSMYGDPGWHAIWRAQLDDEIDAGAARAEYVNLMRWRLERDLGYQWTHQLEIYNTGGVPIYHMIFATDSLPGHKIMSHLYDRAAREFPKMAIEARQQRAQKRLEDVGQYDLFASVGGIEAIGGIVGPAEASTEGLYLHEPPDEPREHDEDSCPYCELVWRRA